MVTESIWSYEYDKYEDEQIEAIEKDIADERAKIKTAVEGEKTKIQNKISELKEKRREKIAKLQEKSKDAAVKSKFKFDQPRLLQLDGEIIGTFEELEVELLQGAVRIISTNKP